MRFEKVKMVNKKWVQKLCVALFFIAYLFLGLSVFDDCGISWDEDGNREHGILALSYLRTKVPHYLEVKNRYHGPAFEIFLATVERLFDLSYNPRLIHLVRHFLTFFVFWVSVFFFYKLAKKHFKDWRLGLLACSFLILAPRIFAHSFHNSVDIPFLSFFIISIYTLTNFLKHKTYSNAFIHALVSGFLVDIRILGIFVPLLTILLTIVYLILKKEKIKPSFFFYLLCQIVFIITFWPILWQSPFYHFIAAFKRMSNYFWNLEVLYMGKFVRPRSLPWHYLPVLFTITTPLLYLVFFLIGLWAIFKKMAKNFSEFLNQNRESLIFLLWFFAPILAVIILKSTLYDGWRHLFFIYPAFLLIAVKGVVYLFKKLKNKTVKIIILLISFSYLSHICFSMIKYHPHQQVYFNILAGKNLQEVKKKFELDYWGTSYRQGLEYIAQNDKSNSIKVWSRDAPAKANLAILPNEDRKRIKFASNFKEADYFLSIFRWHPQEYDYKNEFYSIKIDCAKIMVVYKIND